MLNFKNMNIFAVEKLEEIKEGGKISFYKLIINDRCSYDEFCEDVESDERMAKSLNRIRTYMNYMAETNNILPKTKFNSIKNGKNVIGYEFKDQSIRIYVIKKEPNVFVILGGFKKTQREDIIKFTRIRTECIEYLEQQNETEL